MQPLVQSHVQYVKQVNIHRPEPEVVRNVLEEHIPLHKELLIKLIVRNVPLEQHQLLKERMQQHIVNNVQLERPHQQDHQNVQPVEQEHGQELKPEVVRNVSPEPIHHQQVQHHQMSASNVHLEHIPQQLEQHHQQHV